MFSLSYLRILVDQIQDDYPDVAIDDLPAEVQQSLDSIFDQIEAYEEAHEPTDPPESSQDTFPGTDARIQLMADRFALGQGIFHPQDAKVEEADHIGLEIETLDNGRIDREPFRVHGYVRADYFGKLQATPPTEDKDYGVRVPPGSRAVPDDRGRRVR